MNSIIYALFCPNTNNPVYVGKGYDIKRPLEHIMEKSHSQKINEWIKYLKEDGKSPILVILEQNQPDDIIVAKEKFWINYYINKGYFLLNQSLVNPAWFITNDIGENPNNYDDLEEIRAFIKASRRAAKLTQIQMAKYSGVGLRFVREIESSKKQNFNTVSINKLLYLFGAKLSVTRLKQQ